MNSFLDKKLITTKEAGELSGYTPDYLSRLIRSEKIVGEKVGHSWLVDRESLTRFLDQRNDHKLDRSRTLARERAEEYRAHRSLLYRTTAALTKTPPVPRGGDLVARGLRSQAFAVLLSLFVVGSSAVVARAMAVPQFTEHTAALASETALGFSAAFGDIPSRIAEQVEAARISANGIFRRVAESNITTSARVASPFLAAPDVSPLQTVFGDGAQSRSDIATPAFSSRSDSLAVTPDDVRAFLNDTFAILTSPARAAEAYAGLGANAYAAINGTFRAYRSFIERSGAETLASAAATRDLLATAPQRIAQMNLALGESVINATHAAIGADVAASYGLAAAAPASARAAVALLVTTGDTLARATARVPALAAALFLRATSAPARIGPAIAEAIFNAEYAGAARFIAVTDSVTAQYALALQGLGGAGYENTRGMRDGIGAVGSSIAAIPAALQDLYLEMLGSGALALSHVPQIAAALAAATPALSPIEHVALSTYQALNSFFSSANRGLAFLLSPSPQAIPPADLPRPIVAVSTSSPQTISTPRAPVAYQPSVTNSYPTYTTVVRGISQADLNQSLASLRTTILATVSGMITPVSTQVAQNSSTIQIVNKIEDLSNLIVRNGDFRGGTFSNASSISATNGSFTNLTGGTTALGDTTVSGTLSSSVSASAPFFTATSTTATSTFAGRLAVGTTTPYGSGLLTIGTTSPLLYVDNNTGNVGIGTTSPVALLGMQGALGVNSSQLYLAANGNVGIGTSSPVATLGIQGSIGVSSTHLYLADNGRIGIGTTSPDSLLALQQVTNGTAFLSAYRVTDTAPSGDFINYKQKNGTTLFRVDNSGNLSAGGIITTGSQTITSTSQPQFRVQYDASNEITLSANAFGTTTIGLNGASGGGLVFTPQSSRVNTVNFTDASSNSILSIDTANQRVGIGTASPFAKLDVAGGMAMLSTVSNGSARPAVGTSIISGEIHANNDAADAGLLRLSAGGGTGAFKSYIDLSGYNATSDLNQNIVFGTAGAEKMRIDSSGNVGIGTASPYTKLELVNGKLQVNSGASRGSAGSSDINVFNSAGAKIQFYDNSNSVSVGSIQNGAASDLVFNTNGTASERMRITSAGNVGIGTTTPNYNLTIKGSSGSNASAYIGGDTTSFTLQRTNDAGSATLKYQNAAGSTIWQEGSAIAGSIAGNFGIGNGSSSFIDINSSGNVGIGTTTPNNMLDIYKSSGTDGIGFSGASGSAYKWAIGQDMADAGKFKISSSTSLGTNDRLVIDGNGYVGIGTASPQALLNVYNGNVVLSGSVADSFTKLLIHADGVGSTFVDSSTYAKTITATGNATQSSTQSKFGGKSAYFDGTTGTFLSTPDSADFTFGSGDFTIDLWMMPTSVTGSHTIFTHAIPGHYDAVYLLESGSSLFLYMSSSGAGWDVANGISLGTVSINTWYHIAIVRSSTTVYLFVNGALVNSVAVSTVSLYDSPDSFYIGSSNNVQNYQGYIDEFRVSTGIARWTSAFTPPSSAYSSSPSSSSIGVGVTPVNPLDVSGAAAIGSYAGTNSAPTNGLIVSGNVGVGTTSPVSKLSVVGESAFAGGASVGLGYAGTAAPSNGLIIQGNVGIGTTTPDVKLQVIGNAALNYDGTAIDLRSTTADTASGISSISYDPIYTTGSGRTVVSQIDFLRPSVVSGNYQGDIAFRTRANGSAMAEVMRIQGGGNVGIGTTSPQEKLQVVTGNAAGMQIGSAISPTTLPTAGNNYLKIIGAVGQGADRGGALMLGGASDNANTRTDIFGAVAGLKSADATGVMNGYLAFYTNNNTIVGEKMRIDNSGNVGIGTTSPSAALAISAGTGVTGLRIHAGGAGGVPMLDLSDGNGNNPVFVSNDGKLGIGTASPQGTLQVKTTQANANQSFMIGGPITMSDGVTLNAINDTNLANKSMEFRASAFDFTQGNVGVGSTTPWGLLSVNPNGISGPAFVIGSSTATNFIVTNGGNVGIGTTNPTNKLEVVGNLTVSTTTVASTNSAVVPGYLNFAGSGWNTNTSAQPIGIKLQPVAQYWNAPGSNSPFGQTYPDLAFQFLNSDSGTYSEKMRITGSGNVGIGTTSPAATLSVAGNGYLTGGLGVGVVNTTAGTIQTSGNVTIGGTLSIPANTWMTSNTPTNILRDSYFGYSATYRAVQIGSNSSIRAISLGVDLTGNTSSLFSGNEIVIPNGVGVIAPNAANNSYVGVLSVDANNKLQIGRSNFAVPSGGYLTIDTSGGSQNGNVGIASTSPWGLLSVNPNGIAGPAFVVGSSTATNFIVTNGGNVGIGTASPTTLLHVYGTAADKEIRIDTTGSNKSVIGLANAGVDYGQLYFDNATNNLVLYQKFSAGDLLFGTNTTTNMVIRQGGNVGIGTTTPYSKLSVWGASAAAGTALFELTNSASTTLLTVDNAGNANFPVATATTTIGGGLNVNSGGLTYDLSTGVTSAANLNLGATSFDTDAGVVQWIDMPVTSTSAAGTIESYTAMLNANPMLTIYGLADGLGGMTNLGVGIGTTSPQSTLAIQNAYGMRSNYLFSISSSTASNGSTATDFFNVTNAGNVGIGTASPIFRLDVASTTAGTTGILEILRRGTANDAGLSSTLGHPYLQIGEQEYKTGGGEVQTIGFGYTGSGGIYAPPAEIGYVNTNTAGTTNGALIFGTRSVTTNTVVSERMRIDSTGNVGIGTTSPTAKLQVNNGDLWVSQDSNGLIKLSGAGSVGTYTVRNSTDTGYSSAIYDAIQHIWRYSGTEAMRITTTGNVGIGTTSPWGRLSADSGSLAAGVPSFVVGSSTRTDLVVTQAGFVGIGMTGPDAKLTILNPSTATRFAAASLYEDRAIAAGIGANISFGGRYTGTTVTEWAGVGGIKENATDGNYAGSLGFYTRANGASLAEVARITSAGLVGVGSTTPWGLLSVNGNALGAGVPQFVVGSSTATNFIVTNGGNVGVGTANPSARLHIFHQTQPTNAISDMVIGTDLAAPLVTTEARLTIGNATANSDVMVGQDSTHGALLRWVYNATAANAYGVVDTYAGNNPLVLQDGGGNVGIGTTSPMSLLAVSGAVSGGGEGQTSLLTLANTTANPATLNFRTAHGAGSNWKIGASVLVSSAFELYDVNDAVDRITVLDGGNVGVGSTTPWGLLSVNPNGISGPAFVVGSSTATNFIVTNGGNVGIGTTSPYRPLSVVGTGVFSGLAGAAVTPILDLSRANTLNAAYTQISNGGGNFFIGKESSLGNSVGSGSAAYAGIIWNQANYPVQIGVNDAVVSTFTSTGVGIGTTSPGGLLSVQSTTDSNPIVYVTKGNSGTANQNGGAITFENMGPASTAHNAGVIGGSINFNFSQPTSGASQIGAQIQGIVDYQQAGTRTPTALTFSTYGDPAVNGGIGATGFAERMRISDYGYLGIGTTTPWGLLSVNPNGISGPAFVVGSSTATNFIVTNGGNVGIGTTTPGALLDVSSSVAGFTTLNITNLSGGNGAGSQISFMAKGGQAFNLHEIGRIQAVVTDNADGGGNMAGDLVFSTSIQNTFAEKMRIKSTGNVGIGTSTPYARLSVVDTATGLHDVFAIASSTTLGNIFSVDSYGVTHADGAYTSPAADYAEYFKTENPDLKSGEVVCIDPLNNNAVMRCTRGADNNVMGIVSTKPSVIGNLTKDVKANPSRYAVIGMMGQIEAYASAENGAINVGDSLTSASTTPGYAMLAQGGDSTVGIALEPLTSGTGQIKVLISRRNKSLAVEQVETLVVDRIANMKIEDRVNQIVQQAINAVTQANFTVSGSVAASAFETASAPVTPFVWSEQGSTLDPNSQGRTLFATTTAELPAAVLTAAGGVDLYKLATYNLSGVSALASSTSALAIRVTSLEDRVAKLESGAIGGGATSTPFSLSTTSLASAFEGLGVLIQKGIAQFNTLVFRRLVASKDADGTSSAGSVTIFKGNTVAQVYNSLVAPTTKVFVTFNSQITGSWWVSDKADGSFRIVLSEVQTSDVSFDYFLVQTEGQIATSTPEVAGSVPSVSQSNGIDTTPPVITLLGDNPIHLSVGGIFMEPGVTVADNADGTDPYVTYVNGILQEATAATIDTSIETTYIISYVATDKAGNTSAAVTRSVIVGTQVVGGSGSGVSSSTTNTLQPTTSGADTMAPVVTLVGSAALSLTVGGAFTDPGATATDNVDGDLTAKIVETGSVDTATAGLYTLTYTATDAAGNSSGVSRVVTVAAPATTTTATTTTAVASSTPTI